MITFEFIFGSSGFQQRQVTDDVLERNSKRVDVQQTGLAHQLSDFGCKWKMPTSTDADQHWMTHSEWSGWAPHGGCGRGNWIQPSSLPLETRIELLDLRDELRDI
jgi:hypothetical protein